MGFFDFISDIGDFVTDFIPGGDYIDDFFGFGDTGGSPGNVFDPGFGLLPGQLPIAPPGRRLPPTTNGGQVLAPLQMGSKMLEVCGPPMMTLERRSVAYCRPGYVAVDTTGDGATDTCMRRDCAIALKLYKRRPKPLLTASDRKTLSRSVSVMRKVDAVVKQTNALRGQAKLTKSSRK